MEIKPMKHGRCMQTETHIHINPKRGFEHVTCCHQCCPPWQRHLQPSQCCLAAASGRLEGP